MQVGLQSGLPARRPLGAQIRVGKSDLRPHLGFGVELVFVGGAKGAEAGGTQCQGLRKATDHTQTRVERILAERGRVSGAGCGYELVDVVVREVIDSRRAAESPIFGGK